MTERKAFELLPCPFCGGTDIDPSMASGYHAGDTQRPIIAAGCSGCGAVGPTVSAPTRAAGEAKSVTAWNARAASTGEWISVDERLPDAETKVLAAFLNSHQLPRRICGMYIPRWTVASGGEADCPDEYSEEEDEYYLREGWYECIENWGELSSVYVCEGEITHWMPLPAQEAPSATD